jgi:hypothetical protein
MNFSLKYIDIIFINFNQEIIHFFNSEKQKHYLYDFEYLHSFHRGNGFAASLKQSIHNSDYILYLK